MEFCIISLSKIGFYLGKDWELLLMNNFKYLGLFDHRAEGLVPPKVKEMPWALLIFKYLCTLGKLVKLLRRKWCGKLSWPCFVLKFCQCGVLPLHLVMKVTNYKHFKAIIHHMKICNTIYLPYLLYTTIFSSLLRCT